MYDAYERRRDLAFEESLAQAVDRALYVEWDPDVNLLYVWKGGTTVNVFTLTGKNVDAWMLDEAAFGPVSNDDRLELVQASIRDRVNPVEA